ncbi:MAG: alkaline phosphatase, partial [Clostridia bacterium]|nr:alkaline phosphatase [Clostridia bacterium]
NSALSKTYVKPKNVILMIGDGMGLNDIELTKKFGENLFEFGVLVDKLPNRGLAKTDSLDGLTDSAASGTALATGFKTLNGYLGFDKDTNTLKNTMEIAREKGKRVGIVTNDEVFGATPAAFIAHCDARGKTTDIINQYAKNAPDVLMGAGYAKVTNTLYRADEEKLNIAVNEYGWADALDADASLIKPFFGFMSVDHDEYDNNLARATELSLKRLENQNGFFLMVECATPDKAGHDEKIGQKVVGVSNLDKALAVAVKYCTENPDTILIVTSDHETGGVTIPQGDYSLSNALFTAEAHTNADVGVFALGYGTEYFKDKTVDNTDIGKFIHAAINGEQYK